jgi:UDP-2,3-diacylglucosamine hydrolase
MEKVYFISDVHFGLNDKQAEREKESNLFSFFDRIRSDASHLYILGDLFDYWFEYKHVLPKGFHRVLTQLERITSRDISTHLIVGNHDFWLGERFTEETGVHVYYKPISVTLCGKRFFLHHGDGLNDRDRGYRVLRSILRNRANVFLYRLLHPDLGIGLAKKTSQASRNNHSATVLASEREAIRTHALKKLSDGYDYVVMGHDHTPEQIAAGSRLYVNTGDWITHNSYAVFDGTELSLHYWEKELVS